MSDSYELWRIGDDYRRNLEALHRALKAGRNLEAVEYAVATTHFGRKLLRKQGGREEMHRVWKWAKF